MMIFRNFAILLLPLLIASCASYAPRVDESFQPGPNMVVAYGRLKFTDNVTTNDASAWAYRMALQLVNEDTQKKVMVRFSKQDPIACVVLENGKYKLTGFEATDASGSVLGGKQFGPADKIEVQFQASPNSAVYLGDFSGFAKFNSFGDLTTFETGLTEVTNNYSETTGMFREKYPKLAALPVHSAFEPGGK